MLPAHLRRPIPSGRRFAAKRRAGAASGMQQHAAGGVCPRHQGLAVIKRLGGNLAGVIHAHQGGGFASLGC